MYAEDSQTLPVPPWYKQFWAWFLLSPLLVVMVACTITVTIAFRYADNVVIDNYYKEGRAINQRLGQDQRAGELGIGGDLRFDATAGEIMLALQADSGVALPDSLLVLLDHPTLASRDERFLMHAIAPGRYRADMTRPLHHRWYVYVMPVAAERNLAPWRLLGELDFELDNGLVLKARDP